MSESIFNWLKRAKAQPGTGNVPSDLPSGAAQRKADSLEAGAPPAPAAAAPTAPATPSYTPSQEQRKFMEGMGVRSEALPSGVVPAMAAAAAVPNIGDTISAVAKQSGMTPAEALHPEIKKTLPGINNTVSQAAAETQALGQQPAQPAQPQPRASAAQAKWGPAGSPEAQAFRAQQAGGGGVPPTGTPPGTPQPGLGARAMSGLRSFGQGAMRLAAPVIGIAGAVDAIKNPPGPMDDQLAREMGEWSKKSGEDFGIEFPQGMQDTQRSLRGGLINVTRRIGNAAVPDFIAERAGDKVVGGIADVLKGQAIGTTQFPTDEKKPADVPTTTQPETPAPTSGTVGAPPAEDVLRRNDATGLRSGEGYVRGPGGVSSFAVDKNIRDVPGPAATEEERNKAAWRVHQLENQIQANRAMASPEAGGTGVSLAGFRGQSVSPGGSGGGGGRFGDAFAALSQLQGYGAASRLAKNQADVDNVRAGLGLRAEANNIERQKFGYQMAKDQRENDQKMEEKREKDADALIEGRARQKAGPPGLIGIPGAQKLDPTHEGKVKAAADKLKDEYRHTAANMRDAQGNKLTLGKMSQSQVQQIHMMDDIRNSLAESRETWKKKIPDYVGNKRADSRDLNDYRPVRTEPSSMPGVSKWAVLKTGEKIPVTDLGGGKFTVFGPNSPVDKQMMEMINEAEKQQKKGK